MSGRPKFDATPSGPEDAHALVPLTDRLSAVLPSDAPNPEQALIASQEAIQAPRRRLRIKLESLRPADHLAIELWLSGLSQREIGAWFGVNQQNAARRIQRGIAKLRATMRM